MCGIIGYVGGDEVVPVILDGLRRLEYRGYDSAGMAILGDGDIRILRAAGKLRNLEQRAYHEPLHGTTGIGHTRWATHGAPTEANAHPQVDENAEIAVVHNGILENYASLRRKIAADGCELQSDTDTELIAQLLGRERGSLAERVRAVLPRLVGQYAVVAVSRSEPGTVVAFRQGPPLVVGLGDGENLVASDVTAILHRRGGGGTAGRGRAYRCRGQRHRAERRNPRLGCRAGREGWLSPLHAQGDLRAARRHPQHGPGLPER
jgi:glucosamine--fructose-6-phosphate aminotransferase (isomerizing)